MITATSVIIEQDLLCPVTLRVYGIVLIWAQSTLSL